MRGLVTKSTGSWYTVLPESGETVQCRITGKFRLRGIVTTNPVTVGDRVEFDLLEDGTGLIRKIHERKNYIIRRSTRFHKEAHLLAANIDLAVIMVSLKRPQTPREFIDRFLVTAEAYHISCLIALNKTDLLRDSEEEVEEFCETYSLAGYSCHRMSVEEDHGIDTLYEQMKGKVVLIAGNSGVGKTSFLNRIAPHLQLKISGISDYHQSGKHTTTFSEIFQIEPDTYLIDSPGIRAFGLIDLDKPEIGLYFSEIFRISKDCKFTNCTHLHEPDCAVRNAVEEGRIGVSRYRSYVNIMLDDASKHR